MLCCPVKPSMQETVFVQTNNGLFRGNLLSATAAETDSGSCNTGKQPCPSQAPFSKMTNGFVLVRKTIRRPLKAIRGGQGVDLKWKGEAGTDRACDKMIILYIPCTLSDIGCYMLLGERKEERRLRDWRANYSSVLRLWGPHSQSLFLFGVIVWKKFEDYWDSGYTPYSSSDGWLCPPWGLPFICSIRIAC